MTHTTLNSKLQYRFIIAFCASGAAGTRIASFCIRNPLREVP